MPKGRNYKNLFSSAKKGTKLVKLEKKVDRLERIAVPELKHVHIDQILTPPMSVEVFPSTSVQHCVVLPQGVNGNQRIGNRVKGSHINFAYSLTNYLAAQDANVAARVMLVLDKHPNQLDLGQAATFLSDLFTVSAVNGQYMDPNNQFNPEYRKRFKILYDKVHKIAGNTVAAGADGTKTYVQVKKRIKCPHMMTFDTNTTSGASTTITEGTIWLIYKPQQTQDLGVINAAPQMHWFVDYFFRDS